jgi:hypothetical protein
LSACSRSSQVKPTDAAGAINDLRDVMDVAERAPALLGRGHGRELWWRGQVLATWSLQPGVFRTAALAERERSLTLEFRDRAGTRYSPCPAADDRPGWLFLMQHYRLPTRLLDWTESILAATFFALEEARYENEAGALWALNPSELNRDYIGEAGLVVSEDGRVIDVIDAAFIDPAVVHVPPGTPPKVAAVGPREIDIRMLVQSSAFTVHATSEPLDGLPAASEYVAKYEIPAGAKVRLRHQLRLLGVRRSTLFPDLENLARELSGRLSF